MFFDNVTNIPAPEQSCQLIHPVKIKNEVKIVGACWMKSNKSRDFKLKLWGHSVGFTSTCPGSVKIHFQFSNVKYVSILKSNISRSVHNKELPRDIASGSSHIWG